MSKTPIVSERNREDMVERVAWAICLAASKEGWETAGWTDDGIGYLVSAGWSSYVAEARAAIAAMREPTGGVLNAALFGVGSGYV
jgi:hypothetical protein